MIRPNVESITGFTKRLHLKKEHIGDCNRTCKNKARLNDFLFATNSVDIRDSNSRLKLRWSYPKQKRAGYSNPSVAYAVARLIKDVVRSDDIFTSVNSNKGTSKRLKSEALSDAEEKLIAAAQISQNQAAKGGGRSKTVRIPLEMQGFSLVYYPNVVQMYKINYQATAKLEIKGE